MTASAPTVHFSGINQLEGSGNGRDRRGGPGPRELSNQSLISAPAAPPEEHRHSSLVGAPPLHAHADDARVASLDGHGHGDCDAVRGSRHRCTLAFGGVSKGTAFREIRQARKKTITQRLISEMESDGVAGEGTPLVKPLGAEENSRRPSDASHGDVEGSPSEALKEMFLENKVNLLFAFLPLAWWSQAAGWSKSSVFMLNFIALVPLASMLGVFTEELAAHTNDVIGGLINATFGNAVEMVVAIQALMQGDHRVVQASLIGSIFSNLLLVLGMCFLMGGIKYPEQEFISQGAVASIAMLGFFGLMLLMPEFFVDEREEGGKDVELTVSRISASLLVLMYFQLMFFQLKTHVYLFQGGEDDVALIPFSWALIGLVVMTGIVTILSEWLVGSIDGFCEEFEFGRSFVGVIILPVVGNAVEHISAITVAMKNKMDLALGIALGSSVQIALFVLPMVVLIGEFTGKEMSMKFPRFEVYLYMLAVIIVMMCLTNQRSNWLEGSLLVFTYVIIAVGIYFEDENIDNSTINA